MTIYFQNLFVFKKFLLFSFLSGCICLFFKYKSNKIKQAKIKIGKIFVGGAIKKKVTRICVWDFYKKLFEVCFMALNVIIE